MRLLTLFFIAACEPAKTIIQLEDTNPPYEPGLNSGDDLDPPEPGDTGVYEDTAIDEDCIPEAEVCDGIDNDCDGLVDDSDPDLDLMTTTAFFFDEDGDSFGVADNMIWACEVPDQYSEADGDCAAQNAAVWPGAEESCDGVDNDCDGQIDSVDSCDVPFGVYEGRSYFFVESTLSWAEAEAHCDSFGYALLDIHTEAEFYFVGDLLPYATSIWIGFNDIDIEGHWEWTTGESPTFVNWAFNEPYAYNDCAYIDPVGNWRTSDCSFLSAFVCEASP